MRAATAAFLDRVVAEAARPVELLSVSFGPPTSRDWSLSVMVDEVGPDDGQRRQNDQRPFWSARTER